MTWTLKRNGQRRKYQIRINKTHRRFNTNKKYKKIKKGRIMIGGVGDAFLRYIQSQVSVIPTRKDIKFENHTELSTMINGIVPGTSFSSKINETGQFNNGEDLGRLLRNTLIFYNWTKSLNKNKFEKMNKTDQESIRAETVRLYRHVRIHPTNLEKTITQPIPMSCTWNLDFAIEWMKGYGHSCCIFEIYIPATDVFLPLSMPPPAPADFTPGPLNQSQYEVTVAPCTLTYVGTRDYDGITIHMYNAKTYANLADVEDNFRLVEENGCFQ